MALDDRKRWNERHAAHHGGDGHSKFLEKVLASSAWVIPPGRALDVATGKGRNAIFLASKGFRVDAVDISAAALQDARKAARAEGRAIDFIEADLDHAELPRDAYDLVVNFNFLDRSLITPMKNALKTYGHIVFETYLIEQRELGHPKNPVYLLNHNELLDHFRDFRILYYREGKTIEEGNTSYKAGLVAQKT
ncbi:MAG TPA: methyltransferase domain-containing protein [Verrucomicrobiae bacterium]|nr:methyltransferase domain-containing protein [Verrucomicrobiae bacterium]